VWLFTFVVVVVVVVEPLLVIVEFVNTLQIPIQLNDVTLDCSFNTHTVVLSNDILSNEERVTIKELDDTIIKNPREDIVYIEKISQISMNASEKLLVIPFFFIFFLSWKKIINKSFLCTVVRI
jgi:hypothetical protein